MGFGKDGLGVIVHEQQTLALLGLAGQALVATSSAVSLDSNFRILKTELTATLTGLTSGEGNGLLLYMTEGDLNDASIEANIELNGPKRLGDSAEEEIASRWVRLIGTLDGEAVAAERMFHNDMDGSIITIKPRWTFIRGRTATEGGWNWSVYNNGVTITTGVVVRIIATHYGVWTK